MKRLSLILVAVVVLAEAAACGGKDEVATGLEAQLQGTWASPCELVTGGSAKATFAFSGLRFTWTVLSYANGTCTGTGTVLFIDAGSTAIGSTVTANLGTTPVTAYQVDYTHDSKPGVVDYDLGYVDSTVSPNRFYMGDTSGGNLGTTAAMRPTALDATYWYVKQ